MSVDYFQRNLYSNDLKFSDISISSKNGKKIQFIFLEKDHIDHLNKYEEQDHGPDLLGRDEFGKLSKGFQCSTAVAFINQEPVCYVRTIRTPPQHFRHFGPYDFLKTFEGRSVDSETSYLLNNPDKIEYKSSLYYDLQREKTLMKQFKAILKNPKVDFASVRDDLHGQGIGKATYLFTACVLKKNKLNLMGSATQSEYAKNLWASFRRDQLTEEKSFRLYRKNQNHSFLLGERVESFISRI